MGVYYRYVNFTRREFVDLSDLRDGGDKENAVLYCAPALADALDAITSDKGREYESDNAPRLRSLRDRLADLTGTHS